MKRIFLLFFLVSGLIAESQVTQITMPQFKADTTSATGFSTRGRLYKVIDSLSSLWGGGGSYTFGYGLSESGGTVRVDTSTIQKKLSAGTGIAISNNTIYATTSTIPDVVALVDASTVTWDYDDGNNPAATLELSGATRTLSVTNVPTDGKFYQGVLKVKQHATSANGGLVLPGKVKIGLEIASAAAAETELRWSSYGDGVLYWDYSQVEDASTEATTLLSNFNGSSGAAPTAEVGAFTDVTNFEVDGSGKLQQTTGGSDAFLWWQGATVSKVKLTIGTIPSTFGFSIIMGSTTDADYDDCVLYDCFKDGSDFKIVIYKFVSGSATAITSIHTLPGGMSAGDVFIAELTATTAKFKREGGTELSASHTLTIPGTNYAGIYAGGTGVKFDKVEELQ